MKTDDEVILAADALTGWFRRISTETNWLARDVASVLEQNLAGKTKVDMAAFVGLEEVAKEFLAKNSFAVGAGTFFAAEFVEEGCRVIEWWFEKNSGALERLDANRTPGSNRYYDYEKLPFYSAAASTGELTLWGPFVDVLGVDDYILSFTAPVSVHGNFMGVAGCDLRIKDLESFIMPDLRSISGDAALINASDRVILGNSGKYLVGERIKSEAPNQHRITLDVPHVSLSLIYNTQLRTF